MRAFRVLPVPSRLAAVAAVLTVLTVLVAGFATGTVSAAASTPPAAPAPAVSAPASASAASAPAPASGAAASGTAGSGAAASAGAVLAQDDSGPEMDPQTKADADKAKNKFVVGLIAAALLGIVIWGRIVRRKRAKKGD